MFGLARSGNVLERAVIETLETRRLLSLTVEAEGTDDRAPELTDEEIAIIAEGKEETVVEDYGDPITSEADGEIRYTLGGDEDVELTDGDFEVTMIEDDGSSPCPETTDDNGDPLYCIMETGVTPAPVPTLTDGTLSVTGTDGDDKIRISVGKDNTKLAVKVNGVTTLFSRASITKIKVDALAGNDEITIKQHRGGISIATELNGGDGDDKIRGGNGNDLIGGGAGKDNLRGNAGDDVLSGGDGNDKLFGGRGNDSVLGGDGKDKLRGGGGSDTLDGAKGHDKQRGGRGVDHSFDSDAMLDANKHEKAGRFAAPIWWSEDDGSLDENPWWGDDTSGIDVGEDSGDAAQVIDGALMPIWWDPENPDAQPPVDTGTDEIVIDDGSGEAPKDSPDDVIMY